jgi:predicted LPLAT superfamily acyltransferase
MALSNTSRAATPRNPGPSWGYFFLSCADVVLPARIYDFFLGLGTWVAVVFMPAERRHSRDYLTTILGRPAKFTEVWRHFFAFAQTLALRLRVAEGRPYRCISGPDCAPFAALMASGEPALLGTFHLGHSDLLGYILGEFNRSVHMIRLHVENSRDTRRLAERFGQSVTYLWVNEPENLMYSLKTAVESNALVAMKCDRPGFSAKLEPFEFLGGRRLFPFTIYHLALIFRRPVVFCVSVPHGRNESLVFSSPVFRPDGGSKNENLSLARRHFQDFLTRVESLLRQNPFLWSNFTPLNPVAPAGSAKPAVVA